MDLAKTMEGLSAAALEAVKVTEYKYFGDYELSHDEGEAVDTLVGFARIVTEHLRNGQLIVVDHPQATSPVDSHTAWLEANTNNKIEAGGYTERAIFDMGWDAAMPNLAAKGVEIARLREALDMAAFRMQKIVDRMPPDEDGKSSKALSQTYVDKARQALGDEA